MGKTISFRFKKGNTEHAKIANLLLEGEREKAGYTNEAENERAEQIRNAEAAYKRGEITAAELLRYRVITAKYILTK